MSANVLNVASQIGLWISLIVLCGAVFMAYRLAGQLSESGEIYEKTLEAGPSLGEFITTTFIAVDGSEHCLNGVRSSVLLFAAPTCETCESIKPSVSEFARSRNVNTVAIYVADPSNVIEYAKSISAIGISDVDREYMKALKVPGTPYFIAVDSNGVVRKKGPGVTRPVIKGFFDAVAPASKKRSAVASLLAFGR